MTENIKRKRLEEEQKQQHDKEIEE